MYLNVVWRRLLSSIERKAIGRWSSHHSWSILPSVISGFRRGVNGISALLRCWPLGTVRPLYRTGVSLLSRERFLYILSTNIFHYLIFAWPCIIEINNIHSQLHATIRLINNSSQLNMFRAIILPVFRSTRLCVTAWGIMHPRCCWPVAGNIVGALYHNLYHTV